MASKKKLNSWSKVEYNGTIVNLWEKLYCEALIKHHTEKEKQKNDSNNI